MPLHSFIIDSNKTANTKQLIISWHQAMQKLGFDRLLFTLLMDHDGIARKAGHIAVINYPQIWLEQYSRNHYEEIDPIYHHMFTSKGAFTWESLKSTKQLTQPQIALLDSARLAGLSGGVGIPLRGPFGVLAAVLAASGVTKFPLNIDMLDCTELLCEQFYKVYLRLERKVDINETTKLTEKERNVLKLCAAGKSQLEIAHAMGVTTHAVKFHLKGILFKLKAANQEVAVMKAAAMGLISSPSS